MTATATAAAEPLTPSDRRQPAPIVEVAVPGADVLCYMDVDLSTDLRALLPLIAGLVSGHSDLAIGTRLAPGSRIVRSRKREVISRVYNRLLHLVLRARFTDARSRPADHASRVRLMA
jgi:hypothetical protein